MTTDAASLQLLMALDIKKPAKVMSPKREKPKKIPFKQNEAFKQLPDEIIEQILLFANSNSFASLIVLNRKWRMVSQQAHLYAHHLSRCASYSASHNTLTTPADDESLPHLRQLFAREVKRNLFDAYLRPKETIINLVSTSISSSSAPGGEAFHFSLSPRGHYVLAYSSSRIHVLDVTGKDISVKRELKILRRPASTTITDDGSLLAVLSTDMQVDLYDLTAEQPKHTRAVALDHTPRTIALSPTGSVLAAAYDSGVEVSSLDPDCINTERRAVKCYAVDSLSFSKDGTQLLGTTIQSRNPSTVVLTAPYYDPGGNLPEESTSALWTTSILFPNGSRDCSHAVLLPNSSDDEAAWTFTYDRVFETFRAVRIDDLRNGTTYFTGPTAETAAKLLPSTLPAPSEAGDLVVAGFQGAIWLYGVPEDLEALPNISGNGSNVESEASTPLSQIGRRNSAPSLRTNSRPRESAARTPQWQLLCDRFRNNFVEGQKISSLDRVSAMAWVNDFSMSFLTERLVAVAPGVGDHALENEDDGMTPIDGGRISILDFDYTVTDGEKKIITIEVGNKIPQVLEEEHRDLDTEVAIVRRRTVAQRRGNRSNVSRSSTAIARSAQPDAPPMPTMSDMNEVIAGSTSGSVARAPNPQRLPSIDASETVSIDDYDEGFDAPYSQTNPRSTTTLRRAATAAAVNRRLNPQALAQDHIEYRRADGREEHPHESDADNWVPPPPPYSKDPIPSLPDHIQRSILAEATARNLQRANTQRTPSIDFPGLDGNSLHRSRTLASVSSASSPSREYRRDRFPFPRAVSDTTTRSSRANSLNRMPSPVSPEFDDLYDVSPPGSPQPTPRRMSHPVYGSQVSDQSPQITPETTPITPAALPVPPRQILRKPVGASAPSAPTSPISPITPITPAATMNATLQHPLSPVPQPQPTPELLGKRLMDWEATTESHQMDDLRGRETPTPGNLTQERMEQAVPTRPNEDHHLRDLPPQLPVPKNRREEIESQPSLLARRRVTAPAAARSPIEPDPLPFSRRAETTPAQAKPVEIPNANVPSIMYNLSGPSAEQLARLNSRKDRSSSQILTDPRRASVGYPQPRSVSGPSPHRPVSSIDYPSRNFSQQPPRPTSDLALRSAQPPRGAVGAHGSPSSTIGRPYTSHSPHGKTRSETTSLAAQRSGFSQTGPSYPPSRRMTLNAPPHNQSRLSPVLQSPMTLGGGRPSMQRLDTIHSQASGGGGELRQPVAIGVGRNSSRAERSAAKNIKDAKKRGWRASMRSEGKGKKERSDASSMGWTDVSDMRSVVGDAPGADRNGKEKKGGKCMVM